VEGGPKRKQLEKDGRFPRRRAGEVCILTAAVGRGGGRKKKEPCFQNLRLLRAKRSAGGGRKKQHKGEEKGVKIRRKVRELIKVSGGKKK